MIRILVTGAQGQLGRCIQKVGTNHTEIQFVFHNSKTLDITKKSDVTSVFSEEDYDYCINCAAYTHVDQAEKEPEKAFMVNAEGVQNLAIACKAHKVILIHISTDYVFDGEKEAPYTIADTTKAINVYGASKLAGENHIRTLLDDYFIVRTSWLYSEYGHNFYKTILKKAETEEVLHVADDQTGCPTNANNLAHFILDIIKSDQKEYGLYHFTDGEAMTWYDFAVKILKEKKLDGNTKVVRDKNYRSFVKRPKNSVII